MLENSLEIRHAMITKRTDYHPSNVYPVAGRNNGGSGGGGGGGGGGSGSGGGCCLIKSASTSTCCASENALLKKLRHNKLSPKNAKGETNDENERLKLFVLQPLSHSQQNVHAPLLMSDENVFAKRPTSSQYYNKYRCQGGPKHLRDLGNFGDLSDLARRSNAATSATAASSSCHDEFNTHRSLDNILISKTDDNVLGSIINFTAVNDFKVDHNNTNYMGSEYRTTMSNGTKTCNSTHESFEYPKSSVNNNSKNDGGNVEGNDDCAKYGPENVPQRCREYSTSQNIARREDYTTCLPPATTVADNSSQSTAVDTDTDADAASKNERTENAKSEKLQQNDASGTAEVTASASASASAATTDQEKCFRRSSSLKIHQDKESETSNPARKKIVRFADAMGLDLADVRTFLDELPSVPKSAYNDLHEERVSSSVEGLFSPLTTNSSSSSSSSSSSPSSATFFFATQPKSLVPMFKQPGISSNFLDRVRDNCVCLEHAVVVDTPVCSVSGIVRVRNLDFHKSVYVRYSSDHWRSYTEIPAVYVPDSCDGFSDKFSFIIYVYHMPVSQRIELAVRFHCRGSIFWDNNNGANYVFQSFSSAPIVPSYFQYMPSANDSCHSFY